jgi:FG-GAP-like repeat/IPT/TIG domain/FG-GAP repeat
MSTRRAQPLRLAALVALLAGAALSCGSSGSDDLALTAATPRRISARGGEPLTLRGSGFTAGSSVRLGDAPVDDLEIVSPTEVRFKSPPLFAGRASLVVKTAEGATAELPGGVEVLALDLRFVEAPPYALPSPVDSGMEPSIKGAALGDFDGDGDSDLITCAVAVPCRFVENDGLGNFSDPVDSPTEPRFPAGIPDVRALVAADFDGDGDLDLFLGFGAGGPDMGGPGAVYVNDGKATFTDAGKEALTPDEDAFAAVAVGDLDGDGRPDLVIANATADSVPLRIQRNISEADAIRFTPAIEGAIPARDWIVSAIALADIDGDGDLDILLATPGAADGLSLRLLLNEGGLFDEAPGGLPALLSDSITTLAVDDVTGDGAADILIIGAGQDRLLINDGAGHFFDATTGSMPLDASKGTSAALVDLDRDRDLDLVIGNAGATTRLYLNDGAGRFSDHTPLLPIRDDATVWVGVANVDGDADSDILVLNAAPGPARLYLSVEPPADDAH